MWFNPMMVWLLRSPFHTIISKNTMLITVAGRRSGKIISTPTNYLRDGNTLWVISLRERMWWRNLRGGAQVRVLLAGKNVVGRGQVIEDEKAVAQSLLDYYRKVPQYAKYVKIDLDAEKHPIPEDCERLAQKMVVVKIEHEQPC